MSHAMRVSLLCLAAAVGVSIGFGQATDGNLVGTVADPSGAGVPNAAIQLVNQATGVSYATKSLTAGEYRFNNVPAGRYDLNATATGFGAASVKNVVIELNKTATANVSLPLPTVSTSVEVKEAATLIDTTTAQVGSAYKEREAIDAPVSSLPLGVLNLSLLSAGVASSGGVGLGDGPSVGGQRPRNNNFTVEGVDNTRKDVTGRNVDVPNEAIAEFSILQNQYSAEFGNGTGGQFNSVIRGGTNTIHGAAFEYLQNRNLNAVDESFARQGIRSNPRYDQNTFGGAIGGPIIKNKLFYYGLFQYNPLGQAGTASSAILAPTAQGYSTLDSMSGISKTNLGVLQQYLPAAPSQTATTRVNGTDIPIGILPVTKPSYTNVRTWLTSIDYNISDADQLRGRYIDADTSGFSTETLPALPAFFLGRTTKQKLLAVSEFHNFTPTLFNEVRLGYNRYNDDIPAGNFKFPGLDVFPNITIDRDLNLQLGPFENAPQVTSINTYQLVDNLSWVRGRHTFKFGGDTRRYIAPSRFIQRERGDYDYNTLERFLLDLNPDELAERNVGGSAYWGNQWNYSAFANDDFRIRPNVSLNLGVRYEFKGVPAGDKLQSLNAIASVPGLIDFRAPRPQKTNFMPRLGIAWSPGNSGTTSVRAGFGMAYDKYFDNLGLNASPPQLSSTVDVDPAQTITNFLANGGIPPNARTQGFANAQEARSATSSFIPDQQLPYSIQWNVGVQHVFHNDYTLEVRYLGTRGVHLPVQSRINAQAVVTPDRSLPTYLSRPSPDALAALPYTLNDLRSMSTILPNWEAAGFGDSYITSFPFIGNSIYHGLATELTRRFSAGLLFKAAYTWSHNIDDSTADLFSTLQSPRRAQDFQNMRAERATSFLDRRHRFTFNWIYDTPWYRTSSNWFLREVVGNYTIAGTYIVESPEYASVQSGVDSNLNGDSAGDRAIVNPNGHGITGSAVDPLDRNGNIITNPKQIGNAVAYLARDPSARYIQAGLGAYPNAGRNTIPLRGINDWDFNVKKAFPVGETRRLEFSGQFFNAFNHPQFTPGYPDYALFHESRTTRNNLIPGNALFNRPDQVFASNARTIQLVARFQF